MNGLKLVAVVSPALNNASPTSPSTRIQPLTSTAANCALSPAVRTDILLIVPLAPDANDVKSVQLFAVIETVLPDAPLI